MKIVDGWLQEVEQVLSPNCDKRPDNIAIYLLVFHNISLPRGKFNTPWINKLFTNNLDDSTPLELQELKNLKVSAHVVIYRNGHVIQYVPFHLRAWHAGVSSYQGQEKCNDFSIGIELEGIDDSCYENIQYQKLAEITQVLLNTYPNIMKEHITGHMHIAPNRKTDPGWAFDWEYFLSLLE